MRKIIIASLLVIAAFALVLYSPERALTNPEWHMINVNIGLQGDAHLIVDNGDIVLIDTGTLDAATKMVEPYLKSKNISRIDHLFVSHPHTDHYGGIQALLDAGIRIENIYFNLPPEPVEDWNYKRAEFLSILERAEANGSTLHSLTEGDRVGLPSSEIVVLYAHKLEELNGKKVVVNDFSVILRWSTRGFSTLFTGDLGSDLGTALAVDQTRNAGLKADILKIPHHGVTNIAPNSFFEVVQPGLNMLPSTIALWRHPRGRNAKQWLLEQGSYFCHNGINGTVTLTFGEETIHANSETPTSHCPQGELTLN